MTSPFSTDKKYADQHGFCYLYIGIHPARTTHPFVFTRQDGVGIFFVDEEGNIIWSDKRTLHEVKPKITRWMNVYRSVAGISFWPVGQRVVSKGASNKCIACIKVEFEEGEGL